MGIRYLKHNSIDLQKWDLCISQAINGNIYGYSWYLDAVADHWDALVEGDYERVFPLTYRKKMGLHYLYQPCFAQQLGIYSKTHLTSGVADSFLEKIPGSFPLIEIQLNSFNEPTHESFKIKMRPNLELELISSYEEIFKNYSQNLKRNLKKAGAFSIRTGKDVGLDELIAIFRDNRGKTISTLKGKDYQRLKRLAETCADRNRLIKMGAFDNEGRLHAGVLLVSSHNRMIFLFSSTDATGKDSGAIPYLLDTIIRQYSNKDLILDFEGSEDPSLARFYAGFGAKVYHYPLILRDQLPVLIRAIRKKLP